MAEALLEGWQGGSVSAVIWLFNKYAPSLPHDKDSLADWILGHTDNYYVPFSNYGAKTLSEYYKRRSEHLNEKRGTQIKEEKRHQEAIQRHTIKAINDIFPAITRGDIKAVKALIQKGANLAACNSDGVTPIQWAAKYGKEEIVNILRQP
jgi:hypothetical protein